MIFAFEKKILEWLEENISVLFLIFVTLLSVLIRFSLRDGVSGDLTAFLLPWFEEIKESGGFSTLSRQIGDYNIPYQTIIAFLTYLPFEPTYMYKFLSCTFDYLSGLLVGYLVYTFSTENKKFKGILAYCCIILSPVVFLNSSYWAQCDVIFSFFAVLSLFFFCKEKYLFTFLAFGLSFAFKFQAVFLLPFYLFIYFYKKKYSILYFFCIPLMMIIMGIPGLLKGRSIPDIFLIYFNQTETYGSLYINYPSFWGLFLSTIPSDYSAILKPAAILLTIAILAVLMLCFLKNRIIITPVTLLYMAFIMVFTCILFLPTMHERYGFLYEILSIILVFFFPGTGGLCVILHMLTLITYSSFLFGFSKGTFYPLSIVNIAVYIIYLIIFFQYNRALKAGEKDKL